MGRGHNFHIDIAELVYLLYWLMAGPREAVVGRTDYEGVRCSVGDTRTRFAYRQRVVEVGSTSYPVFSRAAISAATSSS